MNDRLSPDERSMLIQLARQALVDSVCNGSLPRLNLEPLPAALKEPGATFVTLTRHGELRGCIGALEAYQPLAQDVREHAAAAALQDYRFPPVEPHELPELELEVSRLTHPQPLQYKNGEELLTLLRVGVDGVILRDGMRRATFLPQVWEKLPDPAQFLDHLCLKMGVQAQTWRYKKLEVYIYQVEEIRETAQI